MKIAVSGKGGSGKTTIAATLTRVLARRGLPVLAIDGDPNPNLLQALGAGAGVEAAPVPRSVVERREDEEGKARLVLTKPVAEIVGEYGLKAPDGVTVLVGTRDVTVLDMEASIEHLSRGTMKHADALLVVVEPYYRSMETAGRIVPLARGLGLERVYGVANKLRGPQDEQAVEDYCRKHDLPLVAKIPFDESVVEADRAGRAVIDYDEGDFRNQRQVV